MAASVIGTSSMPEVVGSHLVSPAKLLKNLLHLIAYYLTDWPVNVQLSTKGTKCTTMTRNPGDPYTYMAVYTALLHETKHHKYWYKFPASF